MTENEIASIIVNAAYQVHVELGPGLLESVYEQCLAMELKNAGLKVTQQEIVPVYYKTLEINLGFRLDLCVEDKVIVEIKAVSKMEDIFMAQLLTYLKLTENKLGLLINFNVPYIKNGIKRVVNGL
jgi:GxxExxY protein